MRHLYCPIQSNYIINNNVHLISFYSPELASEVKAGQFINVKIGERYEPLLRRPFSVHYIDGNIIEIVFKIVGVGTSILSRKKECEVLDIIGPLGNSFCIEKDCETILLVGGGIGVAPLPMLLKEAKKLGKEVVVFLGAKTKDELIFSHLDNPYIATDDGSYGYHGTVVDLLMKILNENKFSNPKIFGCGPTPMLKNLAALAYQLSIPCEVSLEGMMACGIGLCQGCVIENSNKEMKYSLICKCGPVFNASKIILK